MLGILALDLATSTGWAIRDRNGAVTSGVKTFALARGESFGTRFMRFRRWLVNEVLHDPAGGSRGIGLTALERPHHRGGAATLVCVGLQAIAIEVAASHSVQVATVAASTVKKFVTGKGNAGKDDMVLAARERFDRPEITSDDEADALGILAWAMNEVG